MLIKMAREPDVVSVNGNTAAPALATPAAYKHRGLSDVPDEGVLAAGVPAAMHALVSVLSRFGCLPFVEVVMPALEGSAGHDDVMAFPCKASRQGAADAIGCARAQDYHGF